MRINKFENINADEEVIERKCEVCSNHMEIATMDDLLVEGELKEIIIKIPCSACYSLISFDIKV